MKSIFTTMLVIICFVAAMIFSANNTAMVNINYFIAQSSFNVSHVIGCAFFLGFVLSWLVFLSIHFKLKLKLRQVKNSLAQVQSNHVIETNPSNQERKTIANV